MSDSQVTTKWEEKLKEDTENGTENLIISPVTHGIAAVGTAIVGIGLYRTGGAACNSCPFTNAAHLASLAAHFGTQCWVTFVGGIIMFRTLPRHMFGHLQSYMFPAYFNLGMAANSITLATFLAMHPRGSWTTTDKTQVVALGAALLSSLLSAYVATPYSVRAMWRMYREERALGTGMDVGLKYPDKAQNPQFAALHTRFMRWHGVSSLLNLVGLVANGLHLYHVAVHMRA